MKVILDVTNGFAFVQNADTNAYLEAELAKKYSPTNKPTAEDVGAFPATGGLLNGTLEAAGNVCARWYMSREDNHLSATPRQGIVVKDDSWFYTRTLSEIRSDIGAAPISHTHSASDVGAVPTSRKVNGKALNTDITLNASDVAARPSTWMPTASDVGARPSTWTPSASDVGAVPTSRKVNGKALSSNISLTASDVGAVPKILTSAEYGTSLPAAGTAGRIFFKKVT